MPAEIHLDNNDPAISACSEFVLSEGLNLRPAAMLVRTAERFGCDVFIQSCGVRVDAKIMGNVMRLNAKVGASLRVFTRGSDAEEAMEAVTDLLVNGFRKKHLRGGNFIAPDAFPG